ncbi:MAG: DUF402 domain-containing protein [Lachnospiraceae bacterium]|nr:DUF402 domain-containing protein [Lachnospiraceae bacterium]
MNHPTLYRKRIIPDECVLLKDDEILSYENNILVTRWKTLKPKKDLDHGFSCYFFDFGYKISKFYDREHNLLYYYCDIIDAKINKAENTIVVTDLLADVIVYPDGYVKVVDIDEIVEALNSSSISLEQVKKALYSLDKLLSIIYDDKLDTLTTYMDKFDK